MLSGSSYKQLNKLLEDESFEPRLSWGLRMAISAIVPVLWGLATNNILTASWITLTAECICWVELKGAFTQRLWVLVTGMVLALCFTTLGSITANYHYISVLAIFAVCFLAGLFKNLGDRGSGLAICVYVTFIVSNAYPVQDSTALKDRMALVLIGGIWTMFVGIAGSLFIPLRQPYRRSIALIWKANASLLSAISKGWDGKSLRNSLRVIYQQEKQVRSAIDSSLHLFENRSFQTKNIPLTEQELAKLRKLTSLVGVHIVAIGEELETIRLTDLTTASRLKVNDVITQMQQVVNKMASYIISLKPESLLILHAAIDKANKQTVLLAELAQDTRLHERNLKRIVQLCERSIRIIETGISQLERLEGDEPVYSSYSFLKTLYLLQPKRWFKNTKLLFNFNTLTVRYILRSSFAASIAIFIYKWLNIDHGYWLAFTVVLVMQPYFGATLKKALDRVVGTLTGGIAGGLFILLHDVFYLREFVLFASFIGMVYYLRKNYAFAAFFITLSLVLLFDVESAVDNNIIIMRALCTIGGACLGILAGFALLPDWDSKWLPRHIGSSIRDNYNYFIASFFLKEEVDWTKMKRLAETSNSNAFDSFSRYMSEPAMRKRPVVTLYHIILHNVHITRELNNFHIEDEFEIEDSPVIAADQMLRINDCLYWFNKIIELTKHIDPKFTIHLYENEPNPVKHTYTVHQMFYAIKMLEELKALHHNLSSFVSIIEDRHL